MILAEHHHEHEHTGKGFWQEYFHLVTDGPHWLFELTTNIVFDLLFITLLWGIVIKKVIIPRLEKRIHKEIDEEHGIPPHD